MAVGFLFLLNLWVEVAGLSAAGNPWGHVTFRFQWVGTYQLAAIAAAGTIAWLVVIWRHVLARAPAVRRLLNLPPLQGVVMQSPQPDIQRDLFR